MAGLDWLGKVVRKKVDHENVEQTVSWSLS